MATAFTLVLFLAGERIDAGKFDHLEDCKTAGKQEVQTFHKYHPNSTAWFWCCGQYTEQCHADDKAPL